MKKYLADRGHAILLFLISLLFVNLYFGFICATRVNPGDLYYLDAAAGALALFLLALDYRKQSRICRTLTEEKEISKEEMRKLLGRRQYEIWYREKEEDEEKIQNLYNEILELSDYITLWPMK